MSNGTFDIKKEVKKYIAEFVILLILTIVNVTLSSMHFAVTVGIILALLIAVIQGSMVAYNYMHLSVEKKAIYIVLILTVIFFASMMILFNYSHFCLPEGAKYVP